MPSRTSDNRPAAPAPAPTVPVNVIALPATPVAPAPAPAPEVKPDPLPEAVRAFLVCVPRDIAGLPGLTPDTYTKYLAARDAVEKALAGK